MDPRSDPAIAAAPEPRQRWRLVVARASDAPRLAQRETTDAWEAAVDSSGLPIARSSSSPARPRLAFGAPLPVGMPAERELMDLVLTDRLPRWRVREALEPAMPAGWTLVDLEDVWLGGPALGGIVAAADYRLSFDGTAVAGAVDTACRGLVAARTLPRHREKGGGQVAYDLRPLLVDITVVAPDPPVVVRARTRFHPTLGTGRPEEVAAALGERVGPELGNAAIVRERLLLADQVA